MKTLKLLALALMAVGIVSCGGKKETKESNDASFKVSESSYETIENEEEEIYDDVDSCEEDAEEKKETKDWNTLLDSYEQYVDKCIPYMNKVANGDVSALSEYPALMEKAQEFSNQMEGAQGEMSSSQWERYMKITTKMTEATQKLTNATPTTAITVSTAATMSTAATKAVIDELDDEDDVEDDDVDDDEEDDEE